MDKNSIVVITGANSGIGKAASIELARTRATIIMACRNRERKLLYILQVPMILKG
jgi:NAD(P)-dependent dehydrogenase (short-subunit alcohol dehydrogenase family)